MATNILRRISVSLLPVALLTYLSCEQELTNPCESERICHFELVPNPASQRVSIRYISNVQGNMDFRLLEMNGQTARSITIETRQGFNIRTMFLDDVVAGTYVACLDDGQIDHCIGLVKE